MDPYTATWTCACMDQALSVPREAPLTCPSSPTPSWTTGGLMIDYPGICKKMGWDASKLCGPWLCALRAEDPAECCPYKHPKGSALHGNRPSAEGKPFMMADWIDRFMAQGLVTRRDELKAERLAAKPPPGKPVKTKEGALVYPARHFA